MRMIKRVLALEPARVGSVLAALYAAGIALWRGLHGDEPLDADVIVAAVAAVYGLYVRAKVTPTAKVGGR